MSEQVQEEEKARKSGWVPKEEFQGDLKIWRDAKEFNERGEKIAGISAERLKKATTKIDKLEQEMSSFMAEQKKEREQFMEYNKNRDAVALKKAKAELRADQRQAVEDQDTDAFDEAQSKIDKIETEEKEVKTVKTKGRAEEEADESFGNFTRDNSWYNDDIDMTIYADTAARVLSSKGELMTGGFFKQIVDKVKEKFPDKFENPNRQKPGSVDTGGKSKPSNKKKTFSNLPQDAKDQCEHFMKTIPGFTEESFLKHYDDWEVA